jgi:hypothetical protein
MGRARRAAAWPALLAAAALAVVACSPDPHTSAPTSQAPAPPSRPTHTAAPVPLEPIRTLDACSLLSAKAFRGVAPHALLAYQQHSYGSCAMTASATSGNGKDSSAGLTTVYHVRAAIEANVEDTRDPGWPNTDRQPPRTVAGFTVYPSTADQPRVCQRVISLHDKHAILVWTRSTDTNTKNCAFADAATHSAIDAITHGTVKHLQWRPGSPAAIDDLCDVLIRPVEKVVGAAVQPESGTGMFRCTWTLPGAPEQSEPRPPTIFVGVSASTFPRRTSGASGAVAELPKSALTTVAGHRAECQSSRHQQHFGGYCDVDFGESAFPDEHIVVIINVFGSSPTHGSNPTHASHHVRRLATAVTQALDSQH